MPETTVQLFPPGDPGAGPPSAGPRSNRPIDPASGVPVERRAAGPGTALVAALPAAAAAGAAAGMAGAKAAFEYGTGGMWPGISKLANTSIFALAFIACVVLYRDGRQDSRDQIESYRQADSQRTEKIVGAIERLHGALDAQSAKIDAALSEMRANRVTMERIAAPRRPAPPGDE